MSAGLTSPRLCRCCCTLLTSATLQSAGSCTTAGRRLSSRSFSSRWVAEVVQRVATAGHSWPGVSRSRGSVQCAVQTQTNQLFFFLSCSCCFQGDKEAELGLPFSPLCDRKSTMVAQSQIGEHYSCRDSCSQNFSIFSCCYP